MVNTWTEAMVKEKIELRRRKQKMGNYGLGDQECLEWSLRSVNKSVVGKVGLVVGSESPWVEV